MTVKYLDSWFIGVVVGWSLDGMTFGLLFHQLSYCLFHANLLDAASADIGGERLCVLRIYQV